jgi:FtsP/CotA-like multicopper oxidase with cupredoxin domain
MKKDDERKGLSRRAFLKAGLLTGGLAATVAAGGAAQEDPAGGSEERKSQQGQGGHDSSMTVGEVDLSRFDPTEFLYDFDWGDESRLDDGRMLRTWDVVAQDVDIEVAPGVWFPAWAYNGQVPGPTFRCREGDFLRFNFLNA